MGFGMMGDNINKIVRYRKKSSIGVFYWEYGIIIKNPNNDKYEKYPYWFADINNIERLDLNQKYKIEEYPCGAAMSKSEVNRFRLKNYERFGDDEYDLEVVGEYRDGYLYFDIDPKLDMVAPKGIHYIG